MSDILVRKEYLEVTEDDRHIMFGDSGPYEPFTTNKGQLFKAMQSEYGRCISKVYLDKDDGSMEIGWVFRSREKYDDSNDTYLREVWVTLVEQYECECCGSIKYRSIPLSSLETENV